VSDLPAAEPAAEPAALPPPPSAPRVSVRPIVWLVVGLGVCVLAGSFVATGELAAFLVSSWSAFPLVCLCIAAYLGIERRWARWTAVALVVGLIGLAVLASSTLVVIGVTGLDEEAFSDSSTLTEIGVGVLVVLAAAVAACATWPVIWRRHSGQEAFVLRVALMFVIPMAVVLFAPLIVLNEPPLLVMTSLMLARGEDPDFGRGVTGLVLDSVYGLCWTLPGAVFAVGYGVRRTFAEAVDRLGIVAPTRATWVAVLIVTIALLGGVWLTDMAIGWLWLQLGWPVTDETAVEALFAYASKSMAGAIAVGVTAGLGEEVVVRGVLQPRLGILLTNLAFTAVHAYQYHWDALLQVFAIGLVLGVVRRRTDTTTTALIHSGYDVVALGAAALE
jgi:membrane protease YdiL (CAAX protease family)